MIHVYMRVSSKAQDTELQKPALERAVEGREAVWYRDKFTGKTMNRPGWQKLYNSLKKGDTVLIWRLDRLGRTCHELARLFQEFQERSINLVSVKDSIDLSTPTGRLLANMLASIAQFDNEVRTERVLMGQERAKEAGKTWGGKKAGHRSQRILALESKIKALHKNGDSIRSIAAALDVSRPTIYSILGLTPAVAK